MNKDRKYIDLLWKIAVDITPVSNARIASAIVIGNQIVGLGENSYKTHPFQAKYGSTEHHIHIHAEIDAIKNSLRRVSVDDLKKSSLYICRAKKQEKIWTYGLSRPCDGCMSAIADFDIKRVVYSLNDGGYEELR